MTTATERIPVLVTPAERQPDRPDGESRRPVDG